MRPPEFIDSLAEMEAILREEGLGVLGLIEPQGRPYLVPLNYGYVSGRMLFHCGLKGHKLDCIRANPDVCFTVARQNGRIQRHPGGDPCHVDSESVICHGRARIIVDDFAERAKLLNEFNRCFRPDAAEISEREVRMCAVVEIRLTEMTGRREAGRKVTYWRHKF